MDANCGIVGPQPPCLAGGHIEVLSSVEEVDAEKLINIFQGRILGVRIPGYYPEELATLAADNLVSHHRFGHYVNAENIGRVGMAYFETVESAAHKVKYYGESILAIRDLRKCCDPYFSPMDRLRLDLAEIWPQGAVLENIEGQQMFVGLARVFEDGSEALPHQDILRRDAPNCPKAYTLQAQVAANIYLQPSNAGGDLEIWDSIPNDQEYEALRLSGSYGLDRSLLPPPTVCIKPTKGDLVLFNANCVHAVRAAVGGPRVTLSCFIGYREKAEPLTFWS